MAFPFQWVRDNAWQFYLWKKQWRGSITSSAGQLTDPFLRVEGFFFLLRIGNVGSRPFSNPDVHKVGNILVHAINSLHFLSACLAGWAETAFLPPPHHPLFHCALTQVHSPLLGTASFYTWLLLFLFLPPSFGFIACARNVSSSVMQGRQSFGNQSKFPPSCSHQPTLQSAYHANFTTLQKDNGCVCGGGGKMQKEEKKRSRCSSKFAELAGTTQQRNILEEAKILQG